LSLLSLTKDAASGDRPTVGLFDSGIGGFGTLRAMLRVKTPSWGRILYLADLKNFPYGPRPADEVRRLALAGVELVAELGADLVAVACNTASASGVRAGLVEAPVPIHDIIGPGARHAASVARATGATRVLVLGTEGTVRSGAWEDALREAGYGHEVAGWACPFLANMIEQGRNGPVTRRAVLEATRGLAALGGVPAVGSKRSPDVVILGCTHYSLVSPVVEEVLATAVLGRPVRLVDPSEALARDLEAGLDRTRAGAEGAGGLSGEQAVEVVFLTTGRKEHLEGRARALLPGTAGGAAYRLLLDRVREVALPKGPSGP
jgi:glutamate racemase